MADTPLAIPALLEESLSFNIHRAAVLLRRELVRALRKYSMTPEQWQVMVALWSNKGPLSQRDIALLTLKDKHSVSRIITRLVNNGWVEKAPDKTDGRATSIVPTPKGAALESEIPAALQQAFSPMREAINPQEKKQLIQSLRKLRTLFGDT